MVTAFWFYSPLFCLYNVLFWFCVVSEVGNRVFSVFFFRFPTRTWNLRRRSLLLVVSLGFARARMLLQLKAKWHGGMHAPVLAAMFSRRKSPLDRCCRPKLLATRSEIVPFPEPGGPKITARNSLDISFKHWTCWTELEAPHEIFFQSARSKCSLTLLHFLP